MRSMIVSDKQKILLRDPHPDRITIVIPTAKKITYKGVDLVLVPHELDETRVLNNLGYKIPSPVTIYYNWAGRYTPFAAQKVTVVQLTLNPRMFVLSQIGTGKTMSVLWAFDYLRSIGAVSKMLVATPLSTTERVWGDEIFKHFPHLTVSVLYGDAKRRLAQLEFPADIYIVNHDGLKIPSLRDALVSRKDIDTICVDELAVFRNAGTGQFAAAKKILAGRKYVWGMTGTPIPNRPTDAWAQCMLINPSRVPHYFTRFRDMVERKVSQFKWVPRENALDVVREAMQPAVLFKREECLDLPPTTWEYRYVEMTPEQKAAYKQMLSSFVADAKAGQIVAVNEAARMIKLTQIAVGCAYAQDGSVVRLDAENRIAVLREVIQEADGKVIVFVPLTGALEMVSAALEKDWRVSVVHGGVGKTARDAIFSDFIQKGGVAQVLVAHPKCMSHGLTLTEASTIVWFMPINSCETYEQANGRIIRSGQKRNTLIFHIEGSEVERRMYKRLQTKSSTQGILLDMIKEEIMKK